VPRDLYDEWLDPSRTGDQELLDEALALARPLGEKLQISAI
jgi:hypothetical protein